MMRVLGIVVSVAACSDLPDLGVCGNGIVEADNGEACDGDAGNADTCSATCELLCQDTAIAGYVEVGKDADTGAAQFCPEAMGCGLDGICRAASASFRVLEDASVFDVRFATVGDFDGDRVVDLVGTSATQIVVRFGSSTGSPLADGFEQDAPSSESPIVVFERGSSNGVSDLTLGVPTDGLALLTSNGETFNPDLDTSIPLDEAGFASFVVTDPDPALGDVVMAVSKLGTLAVKRVAIPPKLPADLALAPCGPPGAALIDIEVARDNRSFVVVGRTGPGWFACRYVPSGNAFAAPVVTLFAATPPDSVVLADIGGDDCDELVVARVQPPPALATIVGFAPATAAAGCAFDTTLASLGTLASANTLFAAGSVVTVAPDRDELVMTTGVYRAAGNALELLARPTSDIRPWTSAAIIDLNGDGRLDVVAGRKDQDDVDIVRGGATPNVYRADTDATVTATVAGDFDGDFLGDVAVVEVGNAGQQRVSILYGSSDGLVGPALPNSRFEEGALRLARLRRFTWANTSRGADGIDDLVVSRSIGPMSTGGVLIGDAPRLMTMPRFPATQIPAIGALAIGTLDGTQLLAAAARPLTGASELLVAGIDDNSFAALPLPGFEIDTTQPLTIVRAGAAAPILVGVARGATPGALPDLRAFTAAGTVCAGTAPGFSQARAADLDGDGTDELVTASLDQGRQVHVFAMTAGAGCAIGTEQLVAALAGCVDVVPLGPGTAVALCALGPRRFGAFRVAGDRRDPEPFATIDGIGLQLFAGDFDGDALPDVAVAVGRGADVSIQLSRQCPAHDTRDCR